MGTRTITVPDAGESKAFDMGGCSILVESAPSYQFPRDAAKLSFDQPGENLPLQNRAKWGYPNGPFERIIVEGTEESAGDKISLISTDNLVEDDPGADPDQLKKYVPGDTKVKTASDSVKGFSDLELADDDGNLPEIIYIYVAGGDTAGINYSYGSDPPQGIDADAMKWDNEARYNGTNSAYERQKTNEFLEITGLPEIQAFKFIASVSGETPKLIWTPLY